MASLKDTSCMAAELAAASASTSIFRKGLFLSAKSPRLNDKQEGNALKCLKPLQIRLYVQMFVHHRSSPADVSLWGSCVETAACSAPSPQLRERAGKISTAESGILSVGAETKGGTLGFILWRHRPYY